MTIADAQQHCVAVIKQEAGDDDDLIDNDRFTPLSTGSEGSAQKSGPGSGSANVQQRHHQQSHHTSSSHHRHHNNNKHLSAASSVANAAAAAAAVAAAVVAKHSTSYSSSSAAQSYQQQQQHLQQQLSSRLFNACHNAATTNTSSSGKNLSSHSGGDRTDHSNNGNNGIGSNNNGNTGNNFLLPCPLCEVPLEPRVFRQHLDRHYPRDSPICPVIQCGRRFAHPNSVRNHMRLKHFLQWTKMKAMRSSGGPFSGIP